jgi:PAS domain S-box-containing protein
MKRRSSNLYWLVVTTAAVILLVITTWLQPLGSNWVSAALLVPIFTLLLTFAPIYIGAAEIALTPVLTLTAGFIFGFPTAAVFIALGIALGMGLRRLVKLRQPDAGRQISFLRTGFETGLQLIPLAGALYGWGYYSGLESIGGPLNFTQLLPPVFTFVGLHAFIYALSPVFQSVIQQNEDAWRRWLSLLVVEVLPVPVVVATILVYPSVQAPILVGLYSMTTLLSVALNLIGVTRLKLERRLQELSTLNLISKALSASIHLDSLLENLKTQVTSLLGVDNFYIALYDRQKNELWYPIAVKYGERRIWVRRPTAERLTDRVILTREPILIARNAKKELARIGLPTGEDRMYAWMGAPLISGDRAIGCLGVFSNSPQVGFHAADLDLLVTIAGQVSIAVENSLLYEETEKRSVQLETLNRLSNVLTASLNLQEVLNIICQSVEQVTSARRTAIFIRNQENDLYLAHAVGLKESTQAELENVFIRRWQEASHDRQNQPVLVVDAIPLEMELSDRAALDVEGIQAWGSFPLDTPTGNIGFLSVYYDRPTTIPLDQVELLQTFATQAAIAIQNARLYALTDEALGVRVHQLAILEAIGRRLMASFDTDQLFSTILDYAIEFTKSPWGFLCLYHPQEDSLEIKAKRGYTFEQTIWPVGESITGQTVRTRQVHNLPDVSSAEQFVDVTEGQSHSQLSVPLIYEDQVKGVITLESPEFSAFGENEESLVVQLANYAALAINNAQLYNELQRRLRDQSTLYVVTSHLASSIDVNNLLQVIQEAVQSAVQPTTVGLYLWDENEQVYQIARQSSGEALPLSLVPDLFTRLVPISINVDILKVPSSDPELSQIFGQDENLRTYVVPLEATQQKLGALLLYIPRERILQAAQLQLLQAVIAQASIALQNALLFSDVLNARERLSAILNTIEEGILVVDLRGSIVLANQPVLEFTGLAMDELIGARLVEIPAHALHIMGYSKPQAREIAQKLEHGLAIESPKSTLILEDFKPERVLERAVIPVWSQVGRAIGAMIVLRDTTEEHQLQQTRETITETLIHDLRSPVSAVMSALEILSETMQDGQADELSQQALHVAQRSTEKVIAMVNSLLEIARMQSGEIELEIGAFYVRDLAEQVISNYAILANEYGVFVTNDINPDLPAAAADYNKLERVLSNLLDNALKYTPAGGKVRFSAEKSGENQLIVRVSDNGPGIPEEYREKIFERFNQVPNQSGRRRGTGLGLAFCRLVAEAHGGKIWVEPNQPFGSTFSILLPAASNQN